LWWECIAATFATIVTEKLRPELAALAGCCILLAARVLTANDLFPVFGNEAIITTNRRHRLRESPASGDSHSQRALRLAAGSAARGRDFRLRQQYSGRRRFPADHRDPRPTS